MNVYLKRIIMLFCIIGCLALSSCSFTIEYGDFSRMINIEIIYYDNEQESLENYETIRKLSSEECEYIEIVLSLQNKYLFNFKTTEPRGYALLIEYDICKTFYCNGIIWTVSEYDEFGCNFVNNKKQYQHIMEYLNVNVE